MTIGQPAHHHTGSARRLAFPIVRLVWTLALTTLAVLPTVAFEQLHLDQLKETGSCDDCDLSGADLSGVSLKEASLVGANLDGANLSNADLTWAYVTNASLKSTNLAKANLTDAYFYESDLSGADLSYATIERTNFIGANLTGATLETYSASYRWDFRFADLSGAHIDLYRIEAGGLCNTALPSGLVYLSCDSKRNLFCKTRTVHPYLGYQYDYQCNPDSNSGNAAGAGDY